MFLSFYFGFIVGYFKRQLKKLHLYMCAKFNIAENYNMLELLFASRKKEKKEKFSYIEYYQISERYSLINTNSVPFFFCYKKY